MLKILAIVLGVIVVVTRSICVIVPEVAHKVMKGLLERKVLLLALMVVVAVIGSLFIWGFRRHVPGDATADWMSIVLLVLGIWMAAMALLGLLAPNLAFRMLEWGIKVPPMTMRLLSLLGVAVGVFILIIGLRM